MSQDSRKDLTGRGAGTNPMNRYDKLHVELDHMEDSAFPDEERPKLKTEYFTVSQKRSLTKIKAQIFRFATRSILIAVASMDVRIVTRGRHTNI